MIQIRNVPGPVHRALKARAALAGMSLSEFLLKEIEKVATRPSLDEMLARLAQRATRRSGPRVEDLIREARETGGGRSRR